MNVNTGDEVDLFGSMRWEEALNGAHVPAALLRDPTTNRCGTKWIAEGRDSTMPRKKDQAFTDHEGFWLG